MVFWNFMLLTFIFMNYVYSVTWTLFWFIIGLIFLMLNLSYSVMIYIILLYLGGIFILFTYVSLFSQIKKISFILIYCSSFIFFVSFPIFSTSFFLNLNFLGMLIIFSILFILLMLLLWVSFMFDINKSLRIF